MTNTVELSRMGTFLSHRKEFFVIDDETKYQRVTVQLHGRGIVPRDEVEGSRLKTKKQQATKGGDLLVAEIDAKVGGAGIVPSELEGAIVSSHYFLYEIDETRCDPKYLEFYVRSGAVEAQFQEFVRGSTNYASVRAHHTLELQVPLPSLDQQRRIVARIDELAALVEEAQELRAKARAEATALLSSAMGEVFDVSGGLPDDWRWATVEDVGHGERDTVQTGPFGAQLSSSEFTEKGIPVLAIGNVQWGHLDTNALNCVSNDKATQLSRYRLKPGDILFARMGTVGRSCVVPDFAEDWLISYHIIRIAVDSSVCIPRFLFYALRGSPSVSEAVERRTRGSTRAGVNSRILRELEFPLPPLAEQHCIVAYLESLQDQVDQLTALQNATQVELDALLPSVLDKAFKGEG